MVAFVVKRRLMLFLYAIQDLLDILFYTVDDTLIFVNSSVLGCRTCHINMVNNFVLQKSATIFENISQLDLKFTTLTLMTLNL